MREDLTQAKNQAEQAREKSRSEREEIKEIMSGVND
jgi:hypothetical protein